MEHSLNSPSKGIFITLFLGRKDIYQRLARTLLLRLYNISVGSSIPRVSTPIIAKNTAHKLA